LPHQPTYECAAIHGRFQPFHLGHFSYLLQTADRANRVIIGITNPFIEAGLIAELTDSARHRPSHNPFTLAERISIIEGAISNHDPGMLERMEIVPFDVNAEIGTYSASIPLHVIQFVTAHEPWDVEKADRFKQAGYTVEYLKPEASRITATSVRAMMEAEDSRWCDLVPPGASAAIRRLGLDRRMADLARKRKG
jgi:nicotinamide-nucleotide adenylyltransferase